MLRYPLPCQFLTSKRRAPIWLRANLYPQNHRRKAKSNGGKALFMHKTISKASKLKAFYLSEGRGNIGCNILFQGTIKKRIVNLPRCHQVVRRWWTCYLNYGFEVFNIFLTHLQGVLCQLCIPFRRIRCPRNNCFLLQNISRILRIELMHFRN